MLRSLGRCVMCGRRESEVGRLDPHHVLPVQKGSALIGWPELASVEANVIMLCRGCHDDHERVNNRIPRSKLSPETLALAAGHPDREAYLQKYYP
jgi:hypothetical protein